MEAKQCPWHTVGPSCLCLRAYELLSLTVMEKPREKWEEGPLSLKMAHVQKESNGETGLCSECVNGDTGVKRG